MKAEQNDLITRIGPGTPCGNLLRHYWQPAALVDEFDARLDPRMAQRPVKAVRLLGQDLLELRALRPSAVFAEPLLWRNSVPCSTSAILPVDGEKIPVLVLDVKLNEGAEAEPFATALGPAGPCAPVAPIGP